MVNTQLELIDERELLGKDFKMYGSINEPLFLAKDVATWIEHSDVSKMLNMIDNEEKLIGTLFVSGQNRNVWFVTEDGLYEILMQSRKPIAKRFKKGVKEILKDVRKHGAYMTPATLEKALLNPEFLIKVATELKAEKDRRKALETKIEKDKPLVDFAEHIQTSEDCISMNDMAKLAAKNGIKIGRNRLFEFLRGKKILDYKNVPYQRYIESQPWFEVKESTYYAYGVPKLQMVTKVTPKGQIALVNMLKREYD